MARSIRSMFRSRVVCLLCMIGLGLLESVAIGNPSRGHVCVTQDGSRGRCVPVKQCPSILSTLRKAEHTNEDSWYVYGSECGRAPDGKALVCCVSGSSPPVAQGAPIVPTGTRLSVDGVSSNIPESGSSEAACGLQSGAREIRVHGTSPSIGFHPWTVLLHNGNRPFDTKFPCTGTLISAQYVLTSAGCVDEAEERAKLTARLGEYDLEAAVDCLIPDGEGEDVYCAKPSYDVNVTEVLISESAGEARHDIALLKLSQPVELNEWVSPICLPSSLSIDETATYQAASWNQNTCEDTSRRHKLLSNFTITNRTACGRHLPSGSSEGFLCVSGVGLNPFVDVGGALTVTKPTAGNDQRLKSVHELVGVLTSTMSCANYDGALAYTKVGPHLEWISSKLGQSSPRRGH